ncbi:MAG: undecaprenyl diphosphate synthase family protein, partial [Muribaculaceae bacterium]|nr:undecaprenyl diphosphate synthase family protein [Muribaculaceae bacterium]
ARGEMKAEDINDQTVSDHLSTAGMPDPDLLIRTGGDLRISNFLLWQIAYSEIYITPTYWPDFSEQDFKDAIESYAGRQRRFGLTGEQVK